MCLSRGKWLQAERNLRKFGWTERREHILVNLKKKLAKNVKIRNPICKMIKQGIQTFR